LILKRRSRGFFILKGSPLPEHQEEQQHEEEQDEWRYHIPDLKKIRKNSLYMYKNKTVTSVV